MAKSSSPLRRALVGLEGIAGLELGLLDLEEPALLRELEAVDGVPIGLVLGELGGLDEIEIGLPRAVEGRLVGVVDLGEHHLGRQPAGDEHQLHHVDAELGPEAVIGREHAEDERIGLREAELEKRPVDRREPLALARDLIVEPADLVPDAVIDEERLARAEDGDQRRRSARERYERTRNRAGRRRQARVRRKKA